MSEKRFFTKINKRGKNVIIDKECHTEIFDLTLACEVLNRLDLKRKWLNDENKQLRQRVAFFEKQGDEFEQYTAQTIQNMIANYRDGE